MEFLTRQEGQSSSPWLQVQSVVVRLLLAMSWAVASYCAGLSGNGGMRQQATWSCREQRGNLTDATSSTLPAQVTILVISLSSVGNGGASSLLPFVDLVVSKVMRAALGVTVLQTPGVMPVQGELLRVVTLLWLVQSLFVPLQSTTS